MEYGFARNLKFATSKTSVNSLKKKDVLSYTWQISVPKTVIYFTLNKFYVNSFILLVFPHVANFRYVANFRFLTLSIYTFITVNCLRSSYLTSNGNLLNSISAFVGKAVVSK